MSIRRIGIVLATALFLVNGVLAEQTRQAEIDLQAAIRVETVNGDLKAAITQYETLIARYAKDRAFVASALVRMAGCYQKLGDSESRRIYERVVREFGDQADAVAIARAGLSGAGRDSTGQVSRQVWTGADVDSYGSVSPDGRVMTYTDWSTGNLALHDLVTGKNRPLTDKKDFDSSAEWAFGSAISRDGKQVAYGWMLSAPQVPATERFAEVRIVDANGGTPRVVFRDRGVTGIYVHDWTPDGKWLAVVFNRRDHTWQIGLVSVADGAVRVLKSLPSSPDAVSRVAVSPDGKYVAFDVVANPGAQRQVRVMTIDALGEGEALPLPMNDRVLGWSSDGRHLVFASNRSGLSGIWATRVVAGKLEGEPELIKANVNPKSLGVTRSGALYYAVAGAGQDIYVGSADFDAGQVIAKPAALPATYLGLSDFPSWSPDGKSLAYLALENANSRSRILSSLFVRSMDTGTVREVPHTLSSLWGPDRNRPVWGPDGAFVLVAGADAESRSGIYRIDAKTGVTTPLVVGDPWGTVSAHALSPDGRTLYLKRREPGVQQQVILARDLSSGTERELVRRDGFGDVVVSRDGRWLATVAFDGTNSASLLVMPADGGNVRELLRASDPETLGPFVGWLPDSKTLLFRKFTKGGPRLGKVWRISIEGDGAREILNGMRNPSIHPDGRQFAYAEGTPSLEVWTLENFLPSVRTSK